MKKSLKQAEKISEEQALVYLLKAVTENEHRKHPDYGTPNWCPKCSPLNLGYCRCERACND